MSIDILSDESVNFHIVKALRNEGFNVISVQEKHRGISDLQVLELARNSESILLTEDSDFGEWVFAHKEKVNGVVFLRYIPKETQAIIKALTHVLKIPENVRQYFVVITAKKIRFRKLLR